MDYFMARYPSTPLDGILLDLNSSINVTANSCAVASNTVPSAPPASHVFLWYDPKKLEKGCVNYARMARMLSNFAANDLVAKGYPSKVEIVFGSYSTTNPNMDGSPADDPYSGTLYWHEDGEPVVPVMFVSADAARSLQLLLNGAPTVPVHVVHESGRWTMAFSGKLFLTYRIFLWVVNGLVVLFALCRLFVAEYNRKNAWMIALYMLNVVAGTLLLVMISWRIVSFKYRVLDYYIGWVHSFSFIVVLLMWINMLQRHGVEQSPQFVKFVIHFALVVSGLRFIHIVLEVTGLNTPFRELAQAFFWLVLSPTQYTLAVLFLFYAVRFYRRKRKAKQELRLETMHALDRLVYLSLAGVFCNLVMGFCNQIFTNKELVTSVQTYMLMIVVRYLVCTVRSTALLMFLGLGRNSSLQHEWSLLMSKVRPSSKPK